MANVLKMAKMHAIVGLLELKWSYRRIAKELGVNRGTESRYAQLLEERKSKPAIASPGSGLPDDPKPAIASPGFGRSSLSDLVFPVSGRPPGRASQCEPLREIIKAKLEKGLSAQRIYQDLGVDHGFSGSYSSVKRFVRRLGTSTPLPFRRMEAEPGLEAQVDFGTGAPVMEDGKRRRPHVLRVTLSHSRKSVKGGPIVRRGAVQ